MVLTLLANDAFEFGALSLLRRDKILRSTHKYGCGWSYQNILVSYNCEYVFTIFKRLFLAPST